jgi:hypothetical protein
MEKIVNFCGNCPFKVVIGEDIAICKLSKIEKMEDFQLENDGLETPDWCLLRKNDYTLKFRKFSEERIEDINDVNSEIERLEGKGIKKEDIKELYDELDELLGNEVLDDYGIDISDNISDIKKEIDNLEKAGEKLKKVFGEMGNINFNEKNKD